jgi:PAS domain S-box-containing protein
MSGETNGGRERAYAALRESEQLHRATLSSISDAVFLLDDAGAFVFVCPNVDVIFGYVPDEVRAMEHIGRLLGDGLYEPAELRAVGEIRNLDREITARSGERRTVLVHLKRVSIQGGTVLYTCRDVTELKHAEKELATLRLELAHVARLALVGELTASIVHEIKQPLTSILFNAGAARGWWKARWMPAASRNFASSCTRCRTKSPRPPRSSSGSGRWCAVARSSCAGSS